MDRTSIDIGGGASLELEDMFLYLSDMLSVDGDAGTAMEARVHKGWNKFRQHVLSHTNKGVSLFVRDKLCMCICYGMH